MRNLEKITRTMRCIRDGRQKDRDKTARRILRNWKEEIGEETRATMEIASAWNMVAMALLKIEERIEEKKRNEERWRIQEKDW